MKHCRGFKSAHECEGQLEHVYWEWEGAEYWPSEYDLCTRCADQLEHFLFEEEGGWRRPLHYSRSWADESAALG